MDNNASWNFVVTLVDLDELKQINDNYGHFLVIKLLSPWPISLKQYL